MGGFFLGIAGTAFAVGVPFVNAWFPPERRGLAIGIFGAGMGGTAISALTTVKLFTNAGEKAPFLITAAVLAVYAVVAWSVLRDAPGRVGPDHQPGAAVSAPTPGSRSPGRPASSTPSPSAATSRSRSTCRPTSRPPTGSTPADAANRMAGFVVVAVIMRPVGGWLSDQVRRRSRSWPRLRRRGRRGRDLGRHPAAGRHRHRRVPGHGRGARAPAAVPTFALIAKVTDPAGSAA